MSSNSRKEVEVQKVDGEIRISIRGYQNVTIGNVAKLINTICAQYGNRIGVPIPERPTVFEFYIGEEKGDKTPEEVLSELAGAPVKKKWWVRRAFNYVGKFLKHG